MNSVKDADGDDRRQPSGERLKAFNRFHVTNIREDSVGLPSPEPAGRLSSGRRDFRPPPTAHLPAPSTRRSPEVCPGLAEAPAETPPALPTAPPPSPGGG